MTLHDTQKIDFLKAKIKNSPEYNENIFDLEKYFYYIEPKLNEHINKIKNVDIFNINEFVAAPNYLDLLEDYNFDVISRLDAYAKFLIHVYICCINHNVNLDSFAEVNDIYNIKYNYYIQKTPSSDDFGIMLDYN